MNISLTIMYNTVNFIISDHSFYSTDCLKLIYVRSYLYLTSFVILKEKDRKVDFIENSSVIIDLI